MLCLPAHKQNDSRMGAGTGSSSIDRPLFADASSTKKGHSNYPTCSQMRPYSSDFHAMGNGKWNPLRFNTNHQINIIQIGIIMASWIVAMLLHMRYSIIKSPASMAPATSWPWAPALPPSPKNPMANKHTNNGTQKTKKQPNTNNREKQPNRNNREFHSQHLANLTFPAFPSYPMKTLKYMPLILYILNLFPTNSASW